MNAGRVLFLTMAIAAEGAFALPQVSLESVSPRWPWNGKVDVRYALSGLEADKSYELVSVVTAGGATNAQTNGIQSVNGSFTDVIDCDYLFGGEVNADASLSLELIQKTDDPVPADATGTTVGKKGDVMIIDISAGPTAASYPVTYLDGIDMGRFNCDAYKTGKIVFRKVPAGRYAARPGGSGDWTDDAYLTTTNDYYIGVFLLTQKQYENVMGSIPGSQTQTGDTYPVSCKSWEGWRGSAKCPLGAIYPQAESTSFLPRLAAKAHLPGLDMPTEGRWEIAARANTTMKAGSYWKGWEVDLQVGAFNAGWYTYNNETEGYPSGVKPVGLKYPNMWGLYDTAGNLREWCRDGWNATFRACADIPDDTDNPNSAWGRVTRGGYYGNAEWFIYASYRADANVSRDVSDGKQGLRLACTCVRKRSAVSPAPDATGRAIGVRADVMVIDVSGGPTAETHPVVQYKGVDVGFFNCDAYKKGKIVLRKVKAGTYRIMPGAYPEATAYPTKSIVLAKDYYIGLFEITQKQWLNVVGEWPYAGEANQAQKSETRPLGYVSWVAIRGDYAPDAAVQPDASGQFCERLLAKTGRSFDLPTESQWEVAARGGYVFALGGFLGESGPIENIDGVSLTNAAWYADNNATTEYPAGQKPVGALAPNPFGLYDMLGNVSEWCRDGYSETYSYDYGDSPNPGTDTKRVQRGGNYAASNQNLSNGHVNCAYRGNFSRTTSWAPLGFRLSLTCE